MGIGIDPDQPSIGCLFSAGRSGKYLVAESHSVPAELFLGIPHLRRSCLTVGKRIVFVPFDECSKILTHSQDVDHLSIWSMESRLAIFCIYHEINICRPVLFE
jgi:hypothetical protein